MVVEGFDKEVKKILKIVKETKGADNSGDNRGQKKSWKSVKEGI